jgi:hypothetical protein
VVVGSRKDPRHYGQPPHDKRHFAPRLPGLVSVSVTRYACVLCRTATRNPGRARNKPDWTWGASVRHCCRLKSPVGTSHERVRVGRRCFGAVQNPEPLRLTAPVLGIGTSESAVRELFRDARPSVLNDLRILWRRLVGFGGPERSSAADQPLGERDKWHFTWATSCD